MSAVETPTTGALAKKIEPFACGGSAATFASVVIHPIDLAKVRKEKKRTVSRLRSHRSLKPLFSVQFYDRFECSYLDN